MKISTLTRWIVMLLFLSWPFPQAVASTISGKVNAKGLRSAANILIYLNKAPRPENTPLRTAMQN